jgi:hypothetical protein
MFSKYHPFIWNFLINTVYLRMENNTTQLHEWNNCTDRNIEDEEKITKNADSRSESYCMNNTDISRKLYRVYQTWTLDKM